MSLLRRLSIWSLKVKGYVLDNENVTCGKPSYQRNNWGKGTLISPHTIQQSIQSNQGYGRIRVR